MSSTRDCVSSTRSFFNFVCVNPGQCGCYQAKIQVVYYCKGSSGLRISTPDIPFKFFEARFNFPACSVIFNNFFSREVYVWKKAIGSDSIDITLTDVSLRPFITTPRFWLHLPIDQRFYTFTKLITSQQP